MKRSGYIVLRDLSTPSTDKEEWCISCCTCCALTVLLIIIFFMFSPLIWPWLVFSCNFTLDETPAVVEGYMPSKISFSSCMGNWEDHSLMNQIHSDVHIFLGDSVYGDDYNYEFEAVKPDWLSFFKFPTHVVSYYALMYRKLSCRKPFRDLLVRTPYVLSIWNDHDYGIDDEICTNPMKAKSELMFEEFWQLNIERRNVMGVYGSYEFKKSGASLLIVLLDLHFSTTRVRLFDLEQWEWLTALLAQHKNSTIIMGMSTPMNALYNLYPEEIRAVLSMLNHSKSVIVAGDPHVPSIVRYSTGHVEIISSPLAMVGSASELEFSFCNGNCTVHKNQDNYGMINLQQGVGTVMSMHGPLLQTHIFV